MQSRRSSKACNGCRSKRVKCSGDPQCSNCTSLGILCEYRQQYRTREPFSFHIVNTSSASKSKSSEAIGKPLTCSSEEGYLCSGIIPYYGPSSHQSFVGKLCAYMEKVHRGSDESSFKSLSGSGIDSSCGEIPTVSDLGSLHSLDIPEDEMLHSLAAYFATLHVIFPMIDPEDYISRAKVLWPSLEAGNERDKSTRLALLYLLISIGLSFRPSSENILETSPRVWMDLYYRRAKQALPDIFGAPSVQMVQCLMLISLVLINRCQSNAAYLYSGSAVRTAIAIGMHRVDPSHRKNVHQYEVHRTWIACHTWENMLCLSLGRPSCVCHDMAMVPFCADAFISTGTYAMGTDHSFVRYEYSGFAVRELVRIYNTQSTQADIPAVYTALSLTADHMKTMLKQSPPHIACENVEDILKFSDIQCKEWYWLRLLYLYLRLIMFRPFLVFSAYYSGNFDTAQADVLNAIASGSHECIEAALAIPEILLAMGKRIPAYRANWFSSRYVEPSCAVLLFYILSKSTEIPEETTVRIWIALNQACEYLDFDPPSTVANSRNIASDTLRALQSVIDQSRLARPPQQQQPYWRNEFTKDFFDTFMDADDSLFLPMNQGQLNVDGDITWNGGVTSEPDFEAYWLQTLDLVGFNVPISDFGHTTGP